MLPLYLAMTLFCYLILFVFLRLLGLIFWLFQYQFFLYLPSIFKKDTLSPITPAESFKDRNIESKGKKIQGK